MVWILIAKSSCTTKSNVISFLSPAFYPVFKFIDEVTGDIQQYSGKYNLRITAGGDSPDTMQTFSTDEQHLYNYGMTSSGEKGYE